MFVHITANTWGDNRILMIRYDAAALKEVVARLEVRWNQLAQVPFSFTIYSDHLRAQYRQEERMVSLFTIFTTLSIAIAVIGLVGLVAYSAEQRKKEIGIRKVFGASRGRIYVMINKQYVTLLVIALAVATPLTWFLMQQWLSTFPNRIPVDPLVFLFAGAGELVLSLVCVGYLSLRASMLNPAVVLKDE
jgi:putative ABC transport system permease protein